MHYYKTVLLKSSAPSLTYSSSQLFTKGSIVSVPLKTTVKEAVIVDAVHKPSFDTESIVSLLSKYYSAEQMAMAKFISDYYFSSFSEAISLFLPYTLKHPSTGSATNISTIP